VSVDELGVVLFAPNRRRVGMPRELYQRYWLGLHSTLASRNPEPDFYRVHLVRPASPRLLAVPPGVSSALPGEQQFDGFAELRFASQEAVERWQRHRLVEIVAEDEQNAFSHVAAYWSRAGQAVHVKDTIPAIVIDGPQALPTFIVLARRVPGAADDEFRAYLRERLAPALASLDGIARAGVYLLEPYADDWSSPNVSNDEAGVEYHGWLEVTFTGLDTVGSVMSAQAVTDALADAAGLVSALHAYHEYETYTHRIEGRPTLTGLRGYETVRTAVTVGALNMLADDVTTVTTGYKREGPG
jgi:hypothetical protein